MTLCVKQAQTAAGQTVYVEVHVGLGLPSYEVIGAPIDEVRASRDRVRIALLCAGESWPTGRITVNVMPCAFRPRHLPELDSVIAACITEIVREGEVHVYPPRGTFAFSAQRDTATLAEIADAVPEQDEPPMCGCGRHYVGAPCGHCHAAHRQDGAPRRVTQRERGSRRGAPVPRAHRQQRRGVREAVGLVFDGPVLACVAAGDVTGQACTISGSWVPQNHRGGTPILPRWFCGVHGAHRQG